MPLTGLDSQDLKMIIFGGKGGVGKTSCAVACSIGLAEKYKTLVISTDPAHSVSDSLEQEIGFRLQPVHNVVNLTAIEISADKAFQEFKKEHERELIKLFDTSTNFDDDDIQQMMSMSIPGIDEVMSFKTIIDLIEENNYEKYVVDTAPTGHALRLLSSPVLLDEWIKMAAKMRWKYRYMIESFSGEYKDDEADVMLINLKKTVKRIAALLSNGNKCEFIPVCIPEDMAIMETERLLHELGQFKITSRQLIINNVMESDESGFCRQRKKAQLKYLLKANELFNKLRIVTVPVFPDEIKGLAALNKLKQVLFDVKEQKRDLT
ncbi:MAG: ArsA family ATPase [Pelodictyon phaeoclathratiforme]|jgi:arsenite-transporting ATPase|nr:ArsA family ATPase [Pelodictyon phaeoclathratiforme]